MAENDKPNSEPSHGGSNQPDTHERIIANWTKVVGFFTGMLFVATGISAYFLYKTDITLLRTLEANERPWLQVDTRILGPLTFKEGATISLNLTVKNTGRTPALNAIAGAVLFLDKSSFWLPDANILKTLREIEPHFFTDKMPSGDLAPDAGYAVFSGQTVASKSNATLDSSEYTDKSEVVLMLISYVRYRFTFENKARYSAVLYSMLREGPDFGVALINPRSGTVRVRLEPWGSYAD